MYRSSNSHVALSQYLQEACFLNNEGVAALALPGRKGNEFAIAAFRKSIRILEGLASRVGADAVELEIIDDLVLYDAKEVTDFADEGFYIYDQPKIFCPTQDDASCITRVTAFSACVIFNISLAYHRQALSTGTSKHLRSAQNLYKACAHLCSSLMTANPENQTILALYVASVNNLAHSQECLVERKELDASIRFLRQQLLPRLLQQPPETMTKMEEISLNVTMRLGPSPAASAA